METSWHYAHDGVQKGPVSPDEIRLALVRGEVDRQSLVWCEGMPEWLALESVEDLQPLLAHAPPPLPHQPPPLPAKTPSLPAAAGSSIGDSRDRSDHGEDRSESDRRQRPGKAKRVAEGLLDSTAEWLGKTIGHALKEYFSGRPVVTVVTVITLPLLVASVTYAVIIRRPDPPVLETTGLVRIDANPWGQVQWIRGPGGINIDLPEIRTTPLVMTLPVGNYQAQVVYPHAKASDRCDLQVQPASLATCWLDLAPVDAKSYLKRIGW